MASIQQNIERKKKLAIDEPEFKSTHGLPFMVAPHFEKEFTYYKVGTCHGIYFNTPKEYVILAITNDEKGNGHLQDVFDWFENSCKRDKRNLVIMHMMNAKFTKHLIDKRGFIPFGKEHLIKKIK